MPIYMIRSGQPKLVNRIFRSKYSGVSTIPPEVLMVLVAVKVPGQTNMELKVIHDRYQGPPLNFRVASATHSSCTLAWDPPPQAAPSIQYQISYTSRKDTGFGAFSSDVFPLGPNVWTPQNSWPLTGLQEDYEYRFLIRAKRIAANGEEIISSIAPSYPIVYTGHAASTKQNPSYATDPVGFPAGKPDLFTVNATATDTWTSSYFWGALSYGPDVIQGYGATRARNGYGAVVYGSTRAQMSAKIQAQHPELSAAQLTSVLNTAVVTDSRIAQVVRKKGLTTNSAVTIKVYPSNLNLTNNAAPVAIAAGSTTFVAPAIVAPATTKVVTDLVISTLTTLANEWLKVAPVHNGLLIVNTAAQTGAAATGYNGYAILRSSKASAPTTSVDEDWQLKLWVKWNYTIPDVPATWR
jgi:hypothetical protein